jgi:hypothetical protein
MRSAAIIILAIASYSAVPSAPGAQEFKFDATDFEKPAFQIGGYLEGRTEYFRYDRGSAFYRLNGTETDLGSDNGRTTGTAEIRAKYEKDRVTAFATVHGVSQWDADQGDSQEATLLEGGVAVRPMTGLSIDAGKKVLKWGKGYGWNPVGFVERAKDPTDPDLSREGFWMLTADYVRSFPGPLQTVGITPVVLPVTQSMNEDFGTREHVNFGGKLYLLYEDTDIDFTFLASGTRTARFGADFSRNILSNLEIHGELAFIKDAERRVLDDSGDIVTRRNDALNFLLGLRYLSESDTTYIVEYYRNRSGFAHSEMEDFFRLTQDSVDSFEATGSQALLQKARTLSQAGYGRQTPGRDYPYLRVSQKEPFNILYLTPSVIGIVNLGDRSLSVTPELLYTGITNFEVRLRGGINIGDHLAEFGEKQVEGKIELRVRYFF